MISSYEDIYVMFRNIVFSNTSGRLPRCKEIQTFAVLEEYQQASREQLNKNIPDKFKPYFFSHKWHNEGYPSGDISFEYPLLAVMPTGTIINGIGGGNNCTNQFSIDIAVLDYLTENSYDKYVNTMEHDVLHAGCGCDYDCDERNVFEIYKDTSLLLKDFIYQITKVGVYKNINNDKTFYLIPEYVDGKSEFIKLTSECLILSQLIKNSLKSVKIDQWGGGIAKLHGNLINGLTFSI